MKKRLLVFMLFGLTVVFILALFAAEAKYIGSNKCKMCHISDKRGAQFTLWEQSPHAKAYTTLTSAESKKIAASRGLGDPQKADECLRCHVTAHGYPTTAKEASFKVEEGVGCESCHGPGSEYKTMSVMKALAAGTQDPKAVFYERGSKETCLRCHNEQSPTFKGFNYEEMWPQIAHPVPES